MVLKRKPIASAGGESEVAGLGQKTESLWTQQCRAPNPGPTLHCAERTHPSKGSLSTCVQKSIQGRCLTSITLKRQLLKVCGQAQDSIKNLNGDCL